MTKSQLAEQSLVRDAARWRFTQREGYRVDYHYEVSDVESNVVAVFLGRCWVGCGEDLRGAIDCALWLTEEHGAQVPFSAIKSFWVDHYRRQFHAGRWVNPQPPRFDLADDGKVYLRAPPPIDGASQ